ncbi:MAG TPA: L-aspartate oxidase [Lentisphaeria bacterium]|nr:MAG: L-aspartate oxidase [Lentisphaerae bacterium GWF2_38_69]HBM14833.1 L-aspartate oxidase [Lentisphaeria bacterium]
MQDKYFDVLIIGSGIAGLSAAIAAAEKGASVAVLSKEKEITNCNTNHAQGGIVAAAQGDTSEALIKDINSAGDFLNNNAAVDYLVKNGAPLIEPFLAGKIGVPFCRKEDGHYDMTREGNHSFRRILHVKDYSGAAIEEHLANYAMKLNNITILTQSTVVDLITNSKHSKDCQERYKSTKVIGAYYFQETTGKVKKIFSGSTILATGGVGKLFTFSSNTSGATGDGLALAERVGAEIINCEYVQFHPTVLFNRDIKDFLISEAMRGEGARLRNRKGEYFMKRYSPQLMDLAPRDEVSRAIYQEMENDDAGYVWLDARQIKHVKLEERFPKIFEKCMSAGIDIRKDLIPVVPAAHYFCGGVKVDLEGKTSVNGLWAAGEISCTGVHGANRLASVSLMEGFVWGLNAGLSAASASKSLTDNELLKSIPDWVYAEKQELFDPLLVYQDMSMITKIMWNYCGIVRTKNRLGRAISDISYLRHRIEKFYSSAIIKRNIIELRNAVIAAEIIVRSALANGQSKGCHFLVD